MRKLNHHEIDRLSIETYRKTDKHPIAVVAENIRSMHNLGSILRSSDAAAVERVYLAGYAPDPNHRAVHKTALGAQDTVEWQRSDDAIALVQQLKRTGYTIVALEITDSPASVEEISFEHFPIALLLGNEVEGVSHDLLQLCDFAIQIDQFGTKQSLNVSVAFGITVFDLVRKYRALLGDESSAVSQQRPATAAPVTGP